MENFEVNLHVENDIVGEKAKGIKLTLDTDTGYVIISGTKVTITATGREIEEPLPYGVFNIHTSDLEAHKALNELNLTDDEKVKIDKQIEIANKLNEGVRKLVAKYMQDAYKLNL